MNARARLVVRVFVAVGLLIDATVAVVSLVAQQLYPSLFDIPLRDPALATVLGGAYVVISCVYALVLRDPLRWAPLLWLLALDQAFAALLPTIEIGRGHIDATVKTVGPIPLSAALAIVYAGAASRFARTKA